jgi:collagen type III alpha
MGLLGRLLGRSEPTVTPHSPTVRLPAKGYAVGVAGESQYRSAIERVSGGPSRDGVEWDCVARLVPEPTNPYDTEAVAIFIDDEKVGYLSREAARAYGPTAKALAGRGLVGDTEAVIRGGWNRSTRDKGDYGITLTIAAPDELERWLR